MPSGASGRQFKAGSSGPAFCFARIPSHHRAPPLEFSAASTIVSPCPSTNFIAGVASGTAKCWFARPTGKAPPALIAAPRSCPKNSPCSPPPALPAVVTLPPAMSAARAVVAAVAAAIVTAATEFKRGWRVKDGICRGPSVTVAADFHPRPFPGLIRSL